MNKEKLVEIKNKIKKNAPAILITSLAVVTTASAVYYGMKAIQPVLNNAIEPLKSVDPETKTMLMQDDNFNLFKLTEDEYILARYTE